MVCLQFCTPNVNWDNTSPFIPNIKRAKVIKVYDGDTITIASKVNTLSRKYYRFSVRLARIDCPELRTKDNNEKEYAVKAKESLERLILNPDIRKFFQKASWDNFNSHAKNSSQKLDKFREKILFNKFIDN